jgi:hypothetical protein
MRFLRQDVDLAHRLLGLLREFRRESKYRPNGRFPGYSRATPLR